MKKYIIAVLVLIATLLNFSVSFAGNSTTEGSKKIIDEVNLYVSLLVYQKQKDGYSNTEILQALRKLKIEVTKYNTQSQTKETRIRKIALLASINKAIKKMQGFEKKTISSSSQDAQRLRDLIRISSLKDIATALGAYYSDREKYPDAIPSGCINTKELTHNYMPRGVPSDPINGRLTLGCDGTDNMTFAYRSGKMSDGIPYFVLGVELENASLGNSAEKIDAVTNPNQLVRGSGKYYYLMN